jgi:hypothetical protein
VVLEKKRDLASHRGSICKAHDEELSSLRSWWHVGSSNGEEEVKTKGICLAPCMPIARPPKGSESLVDRWLLRLACEGPSMALSLSLPLSLSHQCVYLDILMDRLNIEPCCYIYIHTVKLEFF